MKELVSIAVPGIRIYLSMLPIIGFQVVSSSFFQATGKPKHSAFLSLSRQVLLLIPAIMILPSFFQLTGVWMAGAVADFISSLITAVFLFSFLRKIKSPDYK